MKGIKTFLIDARTFASQPTGVGMYAYRRSLKSMDENTGAKFTFVCDLEGGAELARLKARGAEIVAYGRRVYNSVAVVGYLRFVCKVAQELRPDVFWQPNNLQPFKVRGAGRTVVTFHDLFPLDGFSFRNALWHCYWRWAFVRTLANADVLEYNSAETKRTVEARSVRARELDGKVVPPVTRVPRREEIAPYPHERAYFLYVGNLETRKGADVLFAAYREYRARGGEFDLLLAGKVRDVAVPRLEGVKWLGYVDEDTKFSLMASCRALVVPSRQEGYGMQVAEAAALGVKLIISDLQVFCEIEGKIAVSVPPGDIGAWTKALLEA